MGHSLRILLIDDEEVVHKTIADYLNDLGHQVDSVYDGISALERIGEWDYDLALVDMRMPGVNGFLLLTSMQEICPKMSIVIITGYANEDMISQSSKIGITNFLTKPIKLLELEAILKSVCLERSY